MTTELLKQKFSKGSKPTEGDFHTLIDTLDNSVEIDALADNQNILDENIKTLQTTVNKVKTYDDTELKEKVTTIENTVNAIQPYDDSMLTQKVTTLENVVDTLENYDDTQVIDRIEVLEDKNNISYDETTLSLSEDNVLSVTETYADSIKSQAVQQFKTDLKSELTMSGGRQAYFGFPIAYKDVANAKYDLILPDKFTGSIELTILASYNNQNSAGFISKMYHTCFTPTAIVSQNTYYKDASRETKASYALSNIYRKDGKNVITISALKAKNGNNFFARFKVSGQDAWEVSYFKDVTVSEAYSDTNTYPTAETPLERIIYGNGSPEGVVTAGVGYAYYNITATGSTNAYYVKTSGTGNIGWIAK